MSNCIKGEAPRSGSEGGVIRYVIEMHEGHLCLRMTHNLDAAGMPAGGSISHDHLRFGTLLDASVGPSDNPAGRDLNNPPLVRAVFKHIGLAKPESDAVFRAVRDAQEARGN